MTWKNESQKHSLASRGIKTKEHKLNAKGEKHLLFHDKKSSDSVFLNWVADRLVYIHKEHPDSDFVIKLRSVANKIDKYDKPQILSYHDYKFELNGKQYYDFTNDKRKLRQIISIKTGKSSKEISKILNDAEKYGVCEF